MMKGRKVQNKMTEELVSRFSKEDSSLKEAALKAELLKEKESSEDLLLKTSYAVANSVDGNLPPWDRKGVMVDLVVDVNKKTITVVVAFKGIMTAKDEDIEEVCQFCQGIAATLERSVPVGWRIL